MSAAPSGTGQGGHRKRLPEWFKTRLPAAGRMAEVRGLVRDHRLHTVCTSAGCPNQRECWSEGTATFMILGNVCTRNCMFCGVPKGNPGTADLDEPRRVAEAIQVLGLKHAVITSVTRDDLDDGGAGIFAATIREVREACPACSIEVLIPDFGGAEASLMTVLNAGPDVLGHNMETVAACYNKVRPQANYARSLNLLARAGARGAVTKTGLMLGLGETREELHSAMRDILSAGCRVLTLGQYLQPGRAYLPVEKYYPPEEFSELREQALSLGFRNVVAGPLVRSSYHAAQLLEQK